MEYNLKFAKNERSSNSNLKTSVKLFKNDCWGPDCPHYRPVADRELLYRKCRFAGQLWTVVYVNSGYVYLTSIDGKQHKRNIAVTEIQLVDEFADPYPEE